MKTEEEKYITCTDKNGMKYRVLKEDLTFRIGVCGVLTRDDSVYLIKDGTTGKWELPGGAIEKGESIEKALSREFLEETGIKIKLDRFVTYKESFYYMRDPDTAYQTLRLFFFVSPFGEPAKEKGAYISMGDLNSENMSELTFQVLREMF